LGRYLEGQGHRMTLQQNHVWPINSLFEIGFYNYFTEMITILRRSVAGNHRMTLQQNHVWPQRFFLYFGNGAGTRLIGKKCVILTYIGNIF
jgi:hypothetical protein